MGFPLQGKGGKGDFKLKASVYRTDNALIVCTVSFTTSPFKYPSYSFRVPGDIPLNIIVQKHLLKISLNASFEKGNNISLPDTKNRKKHIKNFTLAIYVA